MQFPEPVMLLPCHEQVETRATGNERETGERAQEHMGATERVVEVTPPSDPCA
jgi:hypothetical protein